MAAHQAPPSLGFSRQEHWTGLPLPSPMHASMLSRFSRVRLCVTLWIAAHQAPLFTGFSRQEYWSGLPFPSPALASMYVCVYIYTHIYINIYTYLYVFVVYVSVKFCSKTYCVMGGVLTIITNHKDRVNGRGGIQLPWKHTSQIFYCGEHTWPAAHLFYSEIYRCIYTEATFPISCSWPRSKFCRNTKTGQVLGDLDFFERWL